MRGGALSERKPLINLMRVVGLSAGVVSRRTLATLLAIAETEPFDRSVDRWVRLLHAIQTAENRALELPTGYRRKRDPDSAIRSKTRRRSGVRAKFGD